MGSLEDKLGLQHLCDMLVAMPSDDVESEIQAKELHQKSLYLRIGSWDQMRVSWEKGVLRRQEGLGQSLKKPGV